LNGHSIKYLLAFFISAYEVYYDRLKEDFPTLDVIPMCFIKKPIETEKLVKRRRAGT